MCGNAGQFLALKQFLLFPTGRHVLLKTDCGGIHQPPVRYTLSTVTQAGTEDYSVELRATWYVPGVLRGADLLSPGNPLYGEWPLHPQVVEQIWQKYGRPGIDLFASQENTQCPLFSLRNR